MSKNHDARWQRMQLNVSSIKKAFSTFSGYLQGAILVTLTTIIGRLAPPLVVSTNIIMLYLLCVVVTALFWGLAPSIMVCILSVLAHDFFFVKPVRSFWPPSNQDIVTLLVFMLVGIIISYLTSQVRLFTDKSRRHERETQTLYVLSRNLATSDKLDSCIRAVMKSAEETLGYDVAVFLPDSKNSKTLRPYVASMKPALDENGTTEAVWSLQHQKRAGRWTDTFPDADAYYIPLITARGPIGVLALSVDDASSQLTGEQMRLLDAFADLVAVAIERINFAEESQKMQAFQAATGNLQTALLDSISHDLRTPLSSVIGVISSLQENWDLDDAARKSLIQVAREEAERLNYTITNLLDSSRIQAGSIRLSKQLCDVKDIINVALEQLGSRAGGRKVKINAGTELPLIIADFSLIVKVIFNLLDNAIKYSGSDSPVEISWGQVGREIVIEVADRGKGIPPQDIPYLFQRFYRVPGTGGLGAGLGLSICKGIVEAHGGRITAQNRQGGGLVVRLTLPVVYSDDAEV